MSSYNINLDLKPTKYMYVLDNILKYNLLKKLVGGFENYKLIIDTKNKNNHIEKRLNELCSKYEVFKDFVEYTNINKIAMSNFKFVECHPKQRNMETENHDYTVLYSKETNLENRSLNLTNKYGYSFKYKFEILLLDIEELNKFKQEVLDKVYNIKLNVDFSKLSHVINYDFIDHDYLTEYLDKINNTCNTPYGDIVEFINDLDYSTQNKFIDYINQIKYDGLLINEVKAVSFDISNKKYIYNIGKNDIGLMSIAMNDFMYFNANNFIPSKNGGIVKNAFGKHGLQFLS